MKALAPLLSFAVASCSQGISICPVRELTASEYQSDKSCWIANGDEFVALVVLSETDTGYVPTFLSVKCKNIEFYGNELYSLAEYRNAIWYNMAVLRIPNGNSPSKKIRSNSVVHEVSLSTDDKVYYLRAEANISDDNSVMEINIKKVHVFKDIGKSLGKVIKDRAQC